MRGVVLGLSGMQGFGMSSGGCGEGLASGVELFRSGYRSSERGGSG